MTKLIDFGNAKIGSVTIGSMSETDVVRFRADEDESESDAADRAAYAASRAAYKAARKAYKADRATQAGVIAPTYLGDVAGGDIISTEITIVIKR